MKKNKKLLMASIGIITFFITIIEGFLYYSYITDSMLFRVLLTIENSIKCFLFMPKIGILDVMKLSIASTTSFQLFLAYTYSIAVFIAQICTISVIFAIGEKYIFKLISEIRTIVSKKKQSNHI